MARARPPASRRAQDDRRRGLVRARRRAAGLHPVGRSPSRSPRWSASSGSVSSNAREARDRSRSPRRVRSCSGTPTRSRHGSSPRRRTWPRSRRVTPGRLRVGTFQSVGAKIIPAPAPAFLRQPSAGRGRAARVAGRGRAARDDRARRARRDLLDAPGRGGPYETVELLHDPYVLVLPAGSPLATSKRPPTLKEIVLQPIIGFNHCSAMDHVEAQLASTGRAPNIVFRSDNNGTVQGLVGAGVGVGRLPQADGRRGRSEYSGHRPPRTRSRSGDRARVALGPASQRRGGGVRRSRRSTCAASSRPNLPLPRR